MFNRKFLAGGCLLALGWAITFVMAADPPTAGWSEVRQAINQGLPKTAIEKLNPIITRAMEQEKYAEAIRAIGLKIALEGNIQGNKPEEKIVRMRAEIDKAPQEMKPVMNAVLANWFWHYFQQNRWRFMQRTQTAAPPSDDFTTWDLTRILSEIDKQFQKTLAEAELLKGIPVTDYDDLLEKGNVPDTYRPTLYDVLANNAIDFYAAGEQAGARSLDAFDLSAESPIFAAATAFVDWTPESTDETSPTLKAIKLYQDLLRFHEADDDPTAFLDTDLLRLEFGNNKAFGEEKTARFKAALKRFAEEHESHEISSRALHLLATAVHGESDFVKAREIAQQGLKRFPNSIGGRRCFNLIAQIEAPSASVTTERVWNAPLPTIDVNYRNLTKIYLRLLPFDFQRIVIGSNRYQPEQLDHNQRRALLSQRPVHAWSADLPATEDFQQRVESLPAPEGIKKGSYFLIASHNADFSERNNQVTFAEVWISDLAIVTRNHNGKGIVEGFVLDANSGDPLPNAKVRGWYRGDRNQRVEFPATTTDKNGLFRFQSGGRNTQQIVFHASHHGDELSSANYLYNYQSNPAKTNELTQFFTDRSLYRPGQTIHYKGICMALDYEKDNYTTIAGRNITIVFADANNKEISRVNHRTNDYGSFSGSVTAPRDRLMGQMYLRVDGGPNGQTQLRVEEYKRPKFQVELQAPKKAAKLNGIVQLQGKATAYTGAAVNDAKVSWRVVRDVRYPVWWYWRCWWMPARPSASQEIAHGTLQTKPNGTFDLEFTAKPDKSIEEENEPTFRYTVYADVTDSTGETRSSQRVVNVGYTALAASLSTNHWLTDNDPVSIAIRTTTLDGEGQKAKGVLKVYSLKQPAKVVRAKLGGRYHYWRGSINQPPASDPSQPNSWDLDEVVFEQAVETNEAGSETVQVNLEAGIYRAKFEAQDRFGKSITALLPLQVLDPEAKKLNLKIPNLFAVEKASLEPGDDFICLWGSGYKQARAFIEVEHRGKLIQSFWTDPKVTQVMIEQDVTEAMRGGFTVRTTMVRENRAYMNSQRVSVPWSNKQLNIKWEHFVSKLEPASKERWTAIITGPDANKAAAEIVAAMYDASLDAYLPHNWASSFGVFRQDYSAVNSQFENHLKTLQHIYHSWGIPTRDGSLTYRHFPNEIAGNFWNYGYFSRANRRMSAPGGFADRADLFAADAVMEQQSAAAMPAAKNALAKDKDASRARKEVSAATAPDLDNVAARKNLNETAFFFPHLIAGEDGTVKIEFTMPEALTEWKFLGFAHDTELRGGLLTSKTVTAKDLMVEPNPPRFVREGDVIEFTVKVSNQSPTRQTGTVRLSFADARTGDPRDAKLGNVDRDQNFEIAAGESTALAWRISVPDELGFLTYKAVGSTGRLSDGEEGYLPVLSRRILVTESLPLPIRGKQTKEFDFTRLRQSGDSDTLKHQSLTVQMVSNPSWYAVMALPYLMEYPYVCTEQTFNRLYANSLARHIAGSDPKIHRVFEQWRNTPALDSPMEKNQDLKAVMLEETPWLRQAEQESQARRNVGILFDDNRMDEEKRRLIHQITQTQYPDGAWPWFPGGPPNDYITLYITTGFGRLRHLGVEVDMNPAIKSLQRLDNWVKQRYDAIKPADRKRNHLSSLIAFYLYGRSFFLEDRPIADQHREAVNYWQSQAKTYWLELNNRQSQAHIAVAMKRFGELDFAKSVMKSIKERSVSDEELGMFWRDLELSWWWYRAPIETQAMMIEAFDEVADDAEAVEDCKVWLLKQKQTQDWKTTKATADAVYALLLRGTDMLASDALVKVSLGGQTIEAADVEAGTGFYEQRFVGPEIKPEQGQITLTKVDDGVAWGSLHWQYLEDMSKVTPYEGTPLKLTKQLYVKKHTDKGPTLVAVDGPLDVGDELVVRVVLRSDRDMEYVHLKDYRGSGTEPVNVLSRYRYQDGLGYYESTRDTASHFFIDYLPKGIYVFEYSTRVQLRGKYQTGVASIQCMYAPEFNSHSESLPIEVK